MSRPLVSALFSLVLWSLSPWMASSLFAAEVPAINAQTYQPAAGPDDGGLTRLIRPAKVGQWYGLASLHYTRKPLRFTHSSGETRQVQTVLGDLWMLDLGASYAHGSWLFEAALPTAIVMRGGGPALSQTPAPQAPAFGDLRLGLRRHLGRVQVAGALDLGLRLGYALPTAAAGSWLGGSGEELELVALATWTRGPWVVALDGGARLRTRQALTVLAVDAETGEVALDDQGRPTSFDALSVGSVAVIRALAGRSLLDGRLRLRVETQYRTALTGDVTPDQDLFELQAEVDWALGRGVWRVFMGGGTSTTASWGSAQARGELGLRFSPGEMARDSDGDGVDDREDRCPTKAEDRDTFQDADGCPDLDNDRDGVLDDKDACPLRPEDLDGFEDADGCPDLDNDHDGVPDASDRCPVVAEDLDQHEDADGCPDSDNDHDGILDVDDLCPDKAENMNGFEDGDGCPDQPPPPLVIGRADRLRLSGRLIFDYRSAKLSAGSCRLLDAAAVWLKKHPEVKGLSLRAFTDDNGPARALLDLSRRRAEAVKAYLVAAGALKAPLISAQGFGSAHPLTSNDTLRGRTRNHRVEIFLLNKAPVLRQALKTKKTKKKRRRNRRRRR